MNFSMIVPMLNSSDKYKGKLPIEFQYDNKTGDMNCIKSIFGVNLKYVMDIYFIIFKHHEDKYNITSKIVNMIQSKVEQTIKPNVTFMIVTNPTTSQAQTVYDCIKKYDIKGQIFIKDADNMCIYNQTFTGNNVFVFPLEKVSIVDPQHKSYVSVDDQNFVTNIIEKRVVSNLFNCGGYSFANAQDFIDGYEAVQRYEDVLNHMYISHVIYWLILNKRLKFRPLEAIDYEDFEIEKQ